MRVFTAIYRKCELLVAIKSIPFVQIVKNILIFFEIYIDIRKFIAYIASLAR